LLLAKEENREEKTKAIKGEEKNLEKPSGRGEDKKKGKERSTNHISIPCDRSTRTKGRGYLHGGKNMC